MSLRFTGRRDRANRISPSTWQADPQIVDADCASGSALARIDRTHAVSSKAWVPRRPIPARDAAIFSLIEMRTPAAPVLLTGHDAPATWPATLPDLASRYARCSPSALWAPDDDMLAALAHKLFADRQLAVPDAVVTRMLRHARTLSRRHPRFRGRGRRQVARRKAPRHAGLDPGDFRCARRRSIAMTR